MHNLPSITRKSIVAIFVIYVAFGFFVNDIPRVNPDELWLTSEAYFLKTNHHPGSPILPKEVSPFYSSLENMGWKSWLIGTFKSGSAALVMSFEQGNEWHAVRLNAFLWSLLACIGTFFIARKLGLDKWFALLSVAFLVVTPEFFQQIHSERPEIMICAAYILGLIFLLKAVDSTNQAQKKVWFLITGLYAWLPALLIHPSAIIIPGTLGIMFLVHERKRIFHINTLMMGIGLVGGGIFFFFVVKSIGDFATASGGENYFAHHGPPIFERGWIQLLRTPLVFFSKFMDTNFLSRPVSILVFASAMIGLVYFYRSKEHASEKSKLWFYITAVVSPLSILLLFSGSYGKYNIIVFPVIAVILSGITQALMAARPSIGKLAALVLVICFLSNAIGMTANYKYTKEYKRLNSEIKAVVPADGKVMGLALYYLPFKNQKFYSISWFNPGAGIKDQSFEDAINVLGVNYVIVDDAMVARAFLDRGYEWADSLHAYLTRKGKIVKEIHTEYELGIRIPAADLYPSWWRYDGLQKGKMKKILVYCIQ